MKDYSIPLKLVTLIADGKFYSGEYLGKILGINRTTIHNHICTLKSWGLNIYSITGQGYTLITPLQLLNKQKIISHLNQSNLSVIPVIHSTNQYLLDHMEQLSSGDVCIAEYQNEGRGSRGRKWFSPFGSNLYLSMYWHLKQGAVAALGLSLVISVIIAEVIQLLGVNDVKVKWPNDLYLHDRKLAGILVEFTGRTGAAANIVIGIGINLFMDAKAKKEINQDWINLQEVVVKIDRNNLAAKIIDNLRKALPIFETDGLFPFILRWQLLDNFLDRQIKLLIGENEIYGIDRGIDTQGRLLLERNGEITAWYSGEISLKLVN